MAIALSHELNWKRALAVTNRLSCNWLLSLLRDIF
jgi:hypothetical protein